MSTFWPDRYQSAATVTVNVDFESFEQPMLPGEPLWGRYSYGRYGAQDGIWRILELLDRYDTQATFFIPGWDIERYPDVMEAIARAGHETAGRGWANEDFSTLTADEQTDVLERSEQAFERTFGRRPTGWRGPSGVGHLHEPRASLSIPGSMVSAATRPLLAARGYRYDSSFCDDDVPYLVSTDGDRQIVEIPQHTTASDRHYYQAHRLPNVVADALCEEISAVHEAGGLFSLAISPRGDWGSGRGVRIRAVEALFQRLRETPNVWVTTCDDLAGWVLETATNRPMQPS